MRNSSGKTLVEYALIGFLVVLAAMPAVAYLGERISGMYTTSDPINKAQPLFNLLNANAGGNSGMGTSSTSAADGGMNGIDGTSGTLDNTRLAGLGATYTRAIEASSAEGILNNINQGGMGKVTSSLAGSLEDLVDELEAAGELSAEEAAHFRKMSNQGHEIAEIQRVLEEAASRFHGTPDDAVFTNFKKQKVTYQGREMTVNELALLVDFGSLEAAGFQELASGQVDTSRLAFNNPTRSTNELGEFINLYQDTLNFEAYKNNPALQEYVTSLSQTVTYSADFSGSYWYSAFSNEADMKEAMTHHYQEAAQEYALDPAQYAEVTDVSSVRICGVGDGQDSGRSCGN